MQNVCPACNSIINITDNRLIQESCGHKKCRNCFIEERLGCKLCQNEKLQIIPDPPEDQVIENVDNGTVKNNVKKYKGQLKLKTEWTILSETSSKLLSDDVAPKNVPSGLKTDSTLLENSLVLAQRSGDDKLLHTHLSSDETKINETNIEVKTGRTSKKKNSCNLKQRDKISLPSHIRSVQLKEGILYECTICNGKFKFKYHYKYHESCPTGVKPFKCDYCIKTYKTVAHLNYHLKTHLEASEHFCEDCGKSFTQIGTFNRHRKIHTKSKSFHCNLCGKAFITNASLSAHLLRHRNEKLFTCQICQKKFNDKSNLRKHVLSHEIEHKKYLCDLCGKSFKLKWSLVNHKLSHSRGKTHKCSKCNSVFADVNSLKRHDSTHINNKQYPCEYCETHCRRKDNLERHIRNTHPDRIKDQYDNIKTCHRKPIKKHIVSETNIIKGVEETNVIERNKIATNDIERLTQRQDLSNADPKIIKSAIEHSKEQNQSFREENFRIPVINGPIKLSLKNMQHSVKNMYRNTSEDHHIDICRKILQAPSTTHQNKDNLLIPPINNQLDKNHTQNISSYYNAALEDKETNQEYHIELYRKILMPSYVRDNKNEHSSLKVNKINEIHKSNMCETVHDGGRININHSGNNVEEIRETEKNIANNFECRLGYDNHVSTITMVSGNKIINSYTHDCTKKDLL